MPINWEERENELAEIYRKYYPQLAQRAVADVAADLGRDIDAGDALAHVTKQIGKRVKGVTQTQEDRIKSLVNTYNGQPEQLKAALQEALDTTEKRARVIAVTEVKHVENSGRVIGMKSAGLKRALCYDSDNDEKCAAVDGKYVSLDWALANPIGHPYCQRTYEVDPDDLDLADDDVEDEE